ncbi:hypothetical protein [Actinoplanes sp. URMC 104]|uniref:hypothetical protein n=1 Tax=Actinoplanes sp. URMC 104 TaxID=3423409 RepID=UPI003F1BA188
MRVSAILLRLFRLVVLWVFAAVIAAEVIAVGIVTSVSGPMRFSFWLVVFGAAAKYWPLVTGILLISMHFRLFVSNGVTRHEFLRGLGVFALGITLVAPALVVVGHGLESAVLGLLDLRAADYPVFRLGDAGGEFLHVLPATAAYLTSAFLIAAGYYRFRPRTGTLLIVPGAVPVAVADGLIKLDEFGTYVERIPFAVALVLSTVTVGLGCAAAYRLMRDVAVRRTAG